MPDQELTCKCPEGSCGHHSPPVPARYVTTRLGLAEALRKAQAGRLYVTDTPSAADALLEHLTPLPGESAAVPEPVMVLLEDAWTLISATGREFGERNPRWAAMGRAWRGRYEAVLEGFVAASGHGPAKSFTEWCVWYGGSDPNDCAGLLTYDDEEDAAEHAQWFKGGRVASRTVTRGPWQVRS